jgi:F-type H+-transporting ATPase subunit epsilon
MQVVLARVHENLFAGDALSVTLTTGAGEITVLPNHEPFVSNVKPCVVTVRTKDGVQKFDISGGVVEISDNQVSVLL